MGTPGALSGEPERFRMSGPEARLTPDEQDDLRDELARVFSDERSALRLVQQIRFPRARIPNWAGSTPEDWWEDIFVELANGIIATPYRSLIVATLRRYRENALCVRLAERYGLFGEDAPELEPKLKARAAAVLPFPATAKPVPGQCHVICRARTEEDLARVRGTLEALGLGPEEVWSTGTAASYRINTGDVAAARRRLITTDLAFILVAPGEPDYLFRELFFQGPDGSRFRVTDAPAQQTVGGLAGDVVREYTSLGDAGIRPTVVDRLDEEGERHRLDADQTLHEAGIRDGDSFRIGFEGTAGVVNPLDRQDALYRAKRQILGYAGNHPGFVVAANSPTLPTEYEFAFEQPGFGPPRVPGGEPVRVDHHEVLMQLGPEFPEKAPTVFWLSPVFHPNVYPNYDSDAARAEPNAQGLVCLGMLSEGWYPGLDLREVCQTLVEIAGYRNYDLFQPTGDVTLEGAEVRANFFDATAAAWAHGNQAAIEAVGGRPLARRVREPEYPNVIESLD